MAHILLVDDMPMVRNSIGRLLRIEGHRVDTAGDLAEARDCLQEGWPDLVLVDIWMPGGSGLELMRALKSQRPQLPVIVMSGGAPQTPLEYSLAVAEADGATAILVKPFDNRQLLDLLAQLLPGQPDQTSGDIARTLH